MPFVIYIQYAGANIGRMITKLADDTKLVVMWAAKKVVSFSRIYVYISVGKFSRVVTYGI